jgi:hypothetical protein
MMERPSEVLSLKIFGRRDIEIVPYIKETSLSL